MHIAIRVFAALLISLGSAQVFAQSMVLNISDENFAVSNIFSDVDDFDFLIEIDASLGTGEFIDPPITSVAYRVQGTLAPGTPSDFPAFELVREITGEEFYAQGSSLRFEIADTAVLDDGVQIVELVGAGIVFTFDGREVDNGRFHPPVFTLNADGTGQIMNSNNVPTLEPLLEVEPGSEYINSLVFDPGNTTLLEAVAVESSSSGGGAMGWFGLLALALVLGRAIRA